MSRTSVHEEGTAATSGFGDRLRDVVGGSSIAHGYSLTLWVSGAVAAHTSGSMPATTDAVALGVGACLAFAVTGAVVAGRDSFVLRTSPRTAPGLWGVVHLVSVVAGGTAARLVYEALDGVAAWATVGFLFTAAFLWITAAQIWLFDRWRPALNGADHG